MSAPLKKKLMDYCTTDIYPFHMPGHKRNIEMLSEDVVSRALQYDITDSIADFETLGEEVGPIFELEKRIGEMFGTKEAHLLINGSTGGILASISAAACPGKKILVARNSHKSAYNALMIRNIEADFIYPQKLSDNNICINGPILPETIKEALEKSADYSAVFITTPTYEGVVSSIADIAEICHAYSIPLIVDAAHGAHFELFDKAELSALKAGADLVITSIHKTLPMPTQTALLFVQGRLIDRACLKRFLQAYQTSSPSFLLMAGVDSGMDLLQKRGEKLWELYQKRVADLYEKTKAFKHIKLYKPNTPRIRIDKGKLVIYCENKYFTGIQLGKIFSGKFKLEMEMCTGEYVLAMTSIMDTDEGFERLYRAMRWIEEEIEEKINENKEENKEEKIEENIEEKIEEKLKEKIEDAEFTESYLTAVEEKLRNMLGKTCPEFIYAYPPGIPIVAFGEIVSEQAVEEILCGIRNGVRYSYLA